MWMLLMKIRGCKAEEEDGGRLPLSTSEGCRLVEITDLRSSELRPISGRGSMWLFWSPKGLARSPSSVMPRSNANLLEVQIDRDSHSIFPLLPFPFSYRLQHPTRIHITISSTFIKHHTNSFTTLSKSLISSKCLPKPQQRRSPPARPQPARPQPRRRKLERRPPRLATRRSAPRRARKPTPPTSTKVRFRSRVSF